MDTTTVTVAMIKDSVSLTIPVLTGFPLFFGGTLGKLWEKSRSGPAVTISLRLVTAVLISAVLSLWICFLVMFLCINAATGDNHGFFFFTDLAPRSLAAYARYGLFTSYIGFACTVAFAGLFYYRLARQTYGKDDRVRPCSNTGADQSGGQRTANT